MNNIYRKIYEDQYGQIPKDENGRTYEIHHIDGNHENNDISNLKCVSIQEHYDIHFNQGDWAACKLIADRMNLSPNAITVIQSELSKKENKKRIENGTHNFLGDKNPNNKRIKEGTHNFLGPLSPSKIRSKNGVQSRMMTEENLKRIKEGRHHFLGDANPSHYRVKNGTHNFLGDKNPNNKRIKEGTHNFLGESSPSQIIRTCPYCNKTGKGGGMLQWHFSNCKLRPIV